MHYTVASVKGEREEENAEAEAFVQGIFIPHNEAAKNSC